MSFYSILISNNNSLKISDFGTWKPMSEKSAKMTFAGTVAWMAPEVIRNEPCSEKVDIWYVIIAWVPILFSIFSQAIIILVVFVGTTRAADLDINRESRDKKERKASLNKY